MTIKEILQIAENKLQNLRQQEVSAIQSGDLDTVVLIQSSISETETTISQLKTLIPA